MSDELSPIVARLEDVFGASRAVYPDGVPDGELAAEYVLVTSSTGLATSSNLAEEIDRRSPVIFVMSVAWGGSGSNEADLAWAVKWAQRKAVDALAGWRPQIGQATFRLEHVVSSRPARDEDVPDRVVMFATDQFQCHYQP